MDLCSLHPDTVELGNMVEGHSDAGRILYDLPNHPSPLVCLKFLYNLVFSVLPRTPQNTFIDEERTKRRQVTHCLPRALAENLGSRELCPLPTEQITSRMAVIHWALDVLSEQIHYVSLPQQP